MSRSEILAPVPENLCIKRGTAACGPHGWGVFALQPFCQGETVFAGQSSVSSSQLPEAAAYASTCDGDIPIVPDIHFVPLPSGEFEMYGFDSFMNHACNPNTRVEWLSNRCYTHVATRPISAGDELTVSYDDVYFLEKPICFECRCGSPRCRGVSAFGRRT